MNLIMFLQLTQGMIHFLTSPVLIFPNMLTEFSRIITILGPILNSFWIGELPVIALLSVIRIFLFTKIHSSNKIGNPVKIILFLIVLWVLFLILAGCYTRNMIMTPPTWSYDFSVPYAQLFDTLEIGLSFPCLLISYLSYLTICYLIYGTQSIQTSAKSRKNELAILLQFTFIIIYTSFVVIMWHPILIPMMSFIDMNKTRNQAIMNGLWIFDSYVNPIMMLIFNKSIRDDVFIMLKSGGKKNISPVTVTAFSHGPN
ncbi:hypothetical protein B9Z55_017934 [Caenorhabditis nigoni]|nr:hypothetical protein B9Z55_017934 [Caenorhabditis nigoni]